MTYSAQAFLVRDYFPNGADLADVTPADLGRVADEVNHRTRKTLGWARPADLLADLPSSAVEATA